MTWLLRIEPDPGLSLAEMADEKARLRCAADMGEVQLIRTLHQEYTRQQKELNPGRNLRESERAGDSAAATAATAAGPD